MKSFKVILIVIAVISCGKNAYLEEEKSQNRVVLAPPVTGELCNKIETINLYPEFSRRANHTDIPFHFDEKKLNEYSYKVVLQGIHRKILFNAQLVLPFNFEPIQEINGEILRMDLVYAGERVYDTTWHHKPQFCQSNLKTCSGNFQSVHDHVRASTGYTWNDEEYGELIEDLDSVDLGEDYREQNLDIKLDLLKYFDEPEFSTFPSDYLITIADHQLITDAKIVIKYCSN
jgi:hypothetical protein